MKQYQFPIDSYQAEWMFSPVRSNRDVVVLLMNALKVMMLPALPLAGAAGTIILNISKMSRLFFVSDSKIVSIGFPLTAVESDGVLGFKTVHHASVGSRVTSMILEIIESTDALYNREVFNFAEPIDDACEADGDFWCLLRDLLFAEFGYLRYDYDPERESGHLHPLHHLDIGFSNVSTFKLGLSGLCAASDLIEILDIGTNCSYLTSAPK